MGYRLVTWMIGAAMVSAVPMAQGAMAPTVLDRFAARTGLLAARLPAITACAEICASRTIANPALLLDVPYAPQPGFAEEMVNRSGGLANALPSEERTRLVTADDILMFAVRSWDQDGERAMKRLQERHARGQLILLFASRAGAPPDVPADYWFDNGASDGGASEAGVNAMINAMQGMLWGIEYVAAMSRAGHYPGILQGILEEGAAAHNAGLGDHAARRRIYTTDAVMPAGQGGRQYLEAVQAVVDKLREAPVQAQIESAATIIGRQMDGGGTVGLTTCTHLLMSEISLDTHAPWTPFNCVWKTQRGVFEANVGKGDLVVFFGYIGVSSLLEDYASAMRRSGAGMIVSSARDGGNPDNMVPEALARIDQHWSLPDAVVPLPFPPGHMGAISGIESTLLFRMLDEAVASVLNPTP